MNNISVIPDLATNPQPDLSAFLAADGRFLDIVKACRQPRATENGNAAAILKLRHPDGSHSWARTTHALFVTIADAFKGAYLREFDLGTATPPKRPEITDPHLARAVELLDSLIADLHKLAVVNNAPLLRAVADLYQAPLDEMLATVTAEAQKEEYPERPGRDEIITGLAQPPGELPPEALAATTEQAQRLAEKMLAEPSTVTTDHDDPRLNEKHPDGQQKAHVVLSEAERAKGYVRPLRRTYIHTGESPKHPLRDLTAEEKDAYADCGYVKFEQYPEGSHALGRFWTEQDLTPKCGAQTTMPQACAETIAVNPTFYGSTFCTCCKNYFPVNQFTWKGTTEAVGS